MSENSGAIPKLNKRANKSYFGIQHRKKEADIQTKILRKTQEKLNNTFNKNINFLNSNKKYDLYISKNSYWT